MCVSACVCVCVSVSVSVSVIIVDFPNLYELHLFAFSAAGHSCSAAAVLLVLHNQPMRPAKRSGRVE